MADFCTRTTSPEPFSSTAPACHGLYWNAVITNIGAYIGSICFCVSDPAHTSRALTASVGRRRWGIFPLRVNSMGRKARVTCSCMPPCLRPSWSECGAWPSNRCDNALPLARERTQPRARASSNVQAEIYGPHWNDEDCFLIACYHKSSQDFNMDAVGRCFKAGQLVLVAEPKLACKSGPRGGGVFLDGSRSNVDLGGW